MSTTYSLTQLVEVANQTLASEGIASSLNERLVRHYASSKILPSPAKQGRDAVYDENHLNALLALRRSQAAGITSKGYTNLLMSPEGSHDFPGMSTEYSGASTAQLAMVVGAPTKDGALAYLRGISPQVSAPNAAFSSLVQSAPHEFAASAAIRSLGSARPGLVVIPPAPPAETWTTWQVAPGVRFEVRSDLGWTQAAEDSLLAIIATLPKL